MRNQKVAYSKTVADFKKEAQEKSVEDMLEQVLKALAEAFEEKIAELAKKNDVQAIDDPWHFASIYQSFVHPRNQDPLTLQERALLQAAKAADTHTVNRLLEQKVNPNIADAQGITPLMWSMLRDNKEVFVRLLQKQADVNAQDKNGYIALMQAVSLPETPSRQAMIAVLAFLTMRSKLGKVLALTKSHGNKFAVGCITDFLNESLLDAISDDDLEKVNHVLESGADVNARDSYGSTPLMRAACFWPGAREESKGIIQKLIQSGAHLNTHNNDGHTALICAVIGSNFHAAKLLLEAGADSNIITVSEFGNTKSALGLAANKPRMKELIESYQQARGAALIAEAVMEEKIKMEASWAGDIIKGYLTPDEEEINRVVEAQQMVAEKQKEEKRLNESTVRRSQAPQYENKKCIIS